MNTGYVLIIFVTVHRFRVPRLKVKHELSGGIFKKPFRFYSDLYPTSINVSGNKFPTVILSSSFRFQLLGINLLFL